MRKIRFIVEELFRSFRKSLLKNILLMIMFSICLVMTVLMSSYYLDLGDRCAVLDEMIDKDTIWCNLDYMTTSDCGDLTDDFNTVTGCRNMLDYYDELHVSKESPIISINIQQPLLFWDDDMEKLLGDAGYSGPEVFPAYFDVYGGEEVSGVYNLKSAQLDLGAYQMFGLKTQEGEGFTKQNMTLNDISDPIPIILGSDYKGMIEIGTEINVTYWSYRYPCRVVGILEDGVMTPRYGISGLGYWDSCLLNQYIIFPLGIKVAADTDKVDDIEKYANLAFMSLQNGFALVKEENLNNEMRAIRETADKYGIPPVHLEGASLGADIFRKESEAGVRIMLILTVILLCFTFYGLGVVFYDKIRSNRRIYGIYLLNGCSVSMILVSYLIEIALILLPAVFVCRYILIVKSIWAFHESAILNFIYLFTILVFAGGSVFVTLLMRGVDAEHLIRQKD